MRAIYLYCVIFLVGDLSVTALRLVPALWRLPAANNWSKLRSTDKADPDLKQVRGMKGFYVRPSRAIEKGGGFFVPGLEGGKIRVVSAIFLLALCAINASGRSGVLAGSAETALLSSQIMGVAASAVLLAQGLAELLSFTAVDISGDTQLQQEEVSLCVLQSVGSASDSMGCIEAVARSLVGTCPQTTFVCALRREKQSELARIVYELAPPAHHPSPQRVSSLTGTGDTCVVFMTREQYEQRGLHEAEEMLPILPVTVNVVMLSFGHPGLEDEQQLQWVVGFTQISEEMRSILKPWISKLLTVPCPLKLQN